LDVIGGWLIIVLPTLPLLVGGFKHAFYFPFHVWDVILPIDELHHFSRWLKPPTSWLILGW